MNFNELVEQAKESVKSINSERILESLGLQVIPSSAARILPMVAAFGAGAVFGSAVTFILTPKSGQQTREAIGELVQKLIGLAKREATDVKGKVEHAKDEAESMVGSAKDKLSELKDKVVDKAKSFGSDAKSKASDGQSKAKDAASDGQSKAKGAGSKIASA